MKITEKQLLVLLDTTADSLKICGRGIFSFDEETRRLIVNEVLNQQTAVLEAKE